MMYPPVNCSSKTDKLPIIHIRYSSAHAGSQRYFKRLKPRAHSAKDVVGRGAAPGIPGDAVGVRVLLTLLPIPDLNANGSCRRGDAWLTAGRPYSLLIGGQ